MIRKIVAVVLKLVSDDFELQLQCNISMVTYFPQKKVQKMSRFYKPVKTAAQKYRGKNTSHRCAIITCTGVSCLSTAACMYRGFNSRVLHGTRKIPSVPVKEIRLLPSFFMLKDCLTVRFVQKCIRSFSLYT